MPDEWWSPREIVFSGEQMVWLISILPMLREGHYPHSPVEAIAQRRSSSKRRGAYFETPCQLAGEVDVRLEATGIDGKLLVAEIKAGLIESYEARTALRYISGWRRKRMSYSDWKKQRSYLCKNEALLSRQVMKM